MVSRFDVFFKVGTYNLLSGGFSFKVRLLIVFILAGLAKSPQTMSFLSILPRSPNPWGPGVVFDCIVT